MADRQPLALRGEDDFRRDDEAREANRVYLCAGDRRSARLSRSDDLVNWNAERGGTHAVEALRELPRSAARGIRLISLRVVDHFPSSHVARSNDCGAKEKCSRE